MTRLSPESRKAEIIKVGRRVLSEVNYEKFLPSAVAECCQVSEGTVYRYFPTKYDLLMAIAEQWMEEIMLVEPENGETSDAYSRLRDAVHHSLEVVSREPSIARFMFNCARIEGSYRDTKLYKLVARFTSYTTHVIEDGIDSGVFRNDIPTSLLRDIVFGAIEHQTWPYLRNEGGPPLEEVADHIAGMIYRGLAVSPPVKTEIVEKSLERAKMAMQKIDDEFAFIERTVGIKK